MPRKPQDNKQPRAGRPATRRVLERPPDPDDAATPDDDDYIDARRLRERLIALNP
jgi:hypothetical protein